MHEILKQAINCPRSEGGSELATTSIRLLPGGIATPVPAVNQTFLLASLLSDPEGKPRRLSLTHMFRKDGSFAVDLALECSRHTAPEEAIAEALPEPREVSAVARLALPGFHAVPSEIPLLGGACVKLDPPKIDVLSVLEGRLGSAAPAPVLEAETGPAGLILPKREPLLLNPDAVVVALGEWGVDADLSLELLPFRFDADTLRALVAAREKLRIGLYSETSSRLPESFLPSLLARIDRWLRIGRAVRITATLRFSDQVNPVLVDVAMNLLFGGAGCEDRSARGRPNLSGCVLAGDPWPLLAPDLRTVRAVMRSAFRRHHPLTEKRALRIGVAEAGEDVAVTAKALRQHMYVIGGTGVGKTTLLRALILQDISAGRGVFVIDPHGDLHADLCRSLQAADRARLVIADAGNFEAPFSINILEVKGPHAAIQRNFVVSQLIELFKSVYGHNPEAFGPMFESYFRGALMLLMDAGGPEATLSDMERVFGDANYRTSLLERCTDESVVSFWNNIALRAREDAHLDNISPYIVAKLVRLSGNPLIRPIVCTPRSTLDISAALEQGKVVLVNLAKGLTGGPDAAMLGGIITIRLFAAAMARARLPAAGRRLMRVYLDEFQTHAGAVLGEMMAEARKFGLSLVLANQSVAQIDGRGSDIAHAILANSGNLLAFRLGPQDAAVIADWLGPEVSVRTLMDLANHTCIARLLQNGRPLAPLQVATFPAAQSRNHPDR